MANMGYQAEQRVLAVLHVNHGCLKDDKGAIRKLRNYMGVRYAESSVVNTLNQLKRRGLVQYEPNARPCKRIDLVAGTPVDPWAIEELRKAIGTRRRKVRPGSAEHPAPEGWEHGCPEYPAGEPKADEDFSGVALRDVDEESKATAPLAEAMGVPTESGGIDLRALSANLLLEVVSVLTDGSKSTEDPSEVEYWQEEALRLMEVEQANGEAIAGLEALKAELETKLAEASPAATELKQVKRQLDELVVNFQAKDQELRSVRGQHQDALARIRNLEESERRHSDTNRLLRRQYDELAEVVEKARVKQDGVVLDIPAETVMELLRIGGVPQG